MTATDDFRSETAWRKIQATAMASWHFRKHLDASGVFASSHCSRGYPFVASLWLTGRPCPFCGLTSSSGLPLERRSRAISDAFIRLSPLALTALLVLLLGGPCRILWELAGWRPVPKESLRFFWAGSLLLFLVYGAWRICLGVHSHELGLDFRQGDSIQRDQFR